MNGVHDMGGLQDMGPVHHENNEPVFHARWEGRVYGMNRLMSAWRKWNGYTGRAQIEQMPPADYLRMSYYERWYFRLLDLLVNNGLVTREEIARGKPAKGSPKLKPPVTAQQVPAFLNPPPPNTDLPIAAQFKAGQRVRTRNMHPTHLTRLPRYARAHSGIIERDTGVFPFPDLIAHNRPDKPQHVYTVRFAARELWGEQAKPQDSVYLDLWEDYLEPA